MPNTKKSKRKPPIRKTWPKIRIVKIHGSIFYQVDARRKGSNGKRETYRIKDDALNRAAEIQKEFDAEGTEGLALNAEVRVMAIKAQALLDPYGKTISDAARFYEAHLRREKAKAASATVSKLSEMWLLHKTRPNGNKILRQDTIDGIKVTAKMLEREFGDLKVLAISEQTIQDYLDCLKVKLRTKENRRNRFSQFFNWCVKQGHINENPLNGIQIDVPFKEVEILSVEQSIALMEKCETEFPELTVYHAICLFAGLRPSECKLLDWDLINFEEKQITVLAKTSKTKETRNVKIEPTLIDWLENLSGKKSGFIVDQKSYRSQMEKFRASLGYKVRKKNPNGPKWPEDILRHTFASFWLQTYQDRAHLAEQMGNSLKMIKKHYKQIVKTSDAVKFWSILPKKIVAEQKEKDELLEQYASEL